MKHIAAHWRIKLLHILQEVGSICKTRNQLPVKRHECSAVPKTRNQFRGYCPFMTS
jgi:hypothetical protein